MYQSLEHPLVVPTHQPIFGFFISCSFGFYEHPLGEDCVLLSYKKYLSIL